MATTNVTGDVATRSPMETVTSADGTAIAYQRSGNGSPLVLVHGGTADHTRWAPVLSGLEERFAVYAVDRRGRGGSEDTATYAIEREFEDIAAVADAVGEPVNLLGHSYGALCALEAALRTSNLRTLILYEPPIPDGNPIYAPEVLARIEALIDAGDRESALTTFFQDVVHVPPHELTLLRSVPAWPARVAAVHTITREMRAVESYVFDPERFRTMATPTLLLLGGDSPPWVKTVAEALDAALPHSRIAVMPGQQHTAMNTAPELFTREVRQFLAHE